MPTSARRSILLLALTALVGLSFWGALLQPLGWLSLVAIGPAAWVAYDSTRLNVRAYHSSLAYGPGVLFLLTLASWIVVFPWYLTVRDLIKSGRALPKTPPSGGSLTS